jgi:hypothetical protein
MPATTLNSPESTHIAISFYEEQIQMQEEHEKFKADMDKIKEELGPGEHDLPTTILSTTSSIGNTIPCTGIVRCLWLSARLATLRQ